MKHKFFTMLATLSLLVLLGGNAWGANYFWETYDNPPNAGWVTDRYAPAKFESVLFDGDNRLHLEINVNDASAGRPGGQHTTFYNTQGKKIVVNNPFPVVIRGELYIGSDWNVKHRRSDLWVSTWDGISITDYPIIGFANVDGSSPTFRVWDSPAGVWIPIAMAINYGTWYSFEAHFIGTDIFYYINGNLVYTDSDVTGGTAVKEVFVQGYNFGDPALPAAQQAYETYDIYWDNVATYPYNTPLVFNLTQATNYSTIQAAVNAANAGDHLYAMPSIYNERVTINKSLILEGHDEATVILDGTGLAGFGNGIFLTNGTTNVNIKKLTIKNYAGNGPNQYAGIYANAGNNDLAVKNVTIKDNKGGCGFYANGPITNVMLDGLTISGHDNSKGVARGIVIWNGLKSNITIQNCEVFNNNCCGIELQDGTASGVTLINNNVYDNGDNGIGLVGLQGPGENLISGNTLQNNGRFGIEIKNPNGSGNATGAGRIVVENNNVSRTTAIVDSRDIVGIAAFRRGVLPGNVDIPTGAVIRNNTVSGFVQTSLSDGFGIVVEGTNHSVLNNNVSGCDVGIQMQAGHLPYPGDGNQNNVADQYFGRGNSPIACGITISGNTFASNGTDTRYVGATVGSGFVLNTTTGKTFCTIQSAIDDAATVNGHTLKASTGTYTENVNVNKELTIMAASSPLLVGMFTINANNVTIDGFGINNSNGTNAIIVKGKSDITIKNNTIHLIGAIPVGNIHAVLMDLGSSASNNIQILNNEIFNVGSLNSTGSASAITAGFSTANFDLTGLLIKDNKLHHIRANNSTTSGGKGAYGILLNVGAITGTGKVIDPVILNNEIYELQGFWAHGIGLETKTPNAIVSFNKLYNISSTKTSPGPDGFGVFFEANPNAHTVKVNFNSFTNMLFGMGVHPAMTQPSNNIDGKYNWWGHCSGPSPIGDTRCTESAAGTGVGVSCWIDFAPWLGGSFTGLSSILHLNSAYFFVNGPASGTNVDEWPFAWCVNSNKATSPADSRDPLYTIASPPMVEFYTNLSSGGHNWGSSDVMEINYDGTITSTQTDIMQPDGNPKTLFVAFKPESDNNNTRQVIFEAGETTSGFNLYTDNDMLGFGMWNRLERRYVLLNSALNMGQYYLAQLEYDGTTFSGLLDGSLQSPQLGFSGLTKDPDDASGQPSVGIAGEVHGTRFHDYNIFTQNYAHTFNGGIGDVLLFNGILTQAQMNEVYAYFNAKYGQSWTAPTGYTKRGDWFVVAENDGASSLSEAYPNPFSSSTQFIVDLQSEQNVIIELYNSIGELVSVIHNGKLGKGPSIFTIDGSQLTPGMYAYRVSAEGFVQSGKVILIK